MPYVPPLADAQAPEAASNIFRDLYSKFDRVPNFFRTLGHAPAVLEATLYFDAAIQQHLDSKLRVLAYLKTSQLNDCHY